MIMLSMYAKSYSDVRQLNIDTLYLAPPLVGKGVGSDTILRECVDHQPLHNDYTGAYVIWKWWNEDIKKTSDHDDAWEITAIRKNI